MSRIKAVSVVTYVLLSLVVISEPVHASVFTWNGTTSNDLNTAGNWNPTTVPSFSDDTIFNSSVSHINTSPSAIADFSVASINFPNKAKNFTFSFGNCSFSLSDAGITGGQTDTTIAINNIDNSNSVGDLLTFSGFTSTSGNAIMNVNNMGTASGAVSGVTLNRIGDDEVTIYHVFSMLSGGQLILNNTGVDNSTGTGGNSIADISIYQMQFGDAVTVGDNVTISFSNNGTNTSAGSGSTVASCDEGQFQASGAFNAGNGLNLSSQNIGADSSTGTGGDYVGYLASSQMEFDDTFTVGNFATIKATNSGTCSGTNSSFGGNRVGYQDYYQFSLAGVLQAGNFLNFNMTNEGNDSSTGLGGNSVGYSANSQIQISNTFISGDNTTISTSNSGTYTGSNSSSGNNIGFVNNPQFAIDGEFHVGNSLNMTVTNVGINQGSGTGNGVGYIGDPQVEFNNTCALGDDATITVSNSGTNSTGVSEGSTGFVTSNELIAHGIF